MIDRKFFVMPIFLFSMTWVVSEIGWAQSEAAIESVESSPFEGKLFRAEDIEQKGGRHKLVVYLREKKKKVFDYGPISFVTDLVRIQEFSLNGHTYLVAVWGYGAHSEKFAILDPQKPDRPLLYDRVTSWPADFKVVSNYLEITAPEDTMKNLMSKDRVPTNKIIIWRPELGTEPKTDQGTSSEQGTGSTESIE